MKPWNSAGPRFVGLGVLLLLALALSTPPSAAGPEPGRTLLPLSRPAFTGSSASTHTPAPPGQAPIAAASGPAGVQARYCTDLLRNGGFESGNFLYWTTSGAPVVLSTGGHTGSHSAQLGGRDNALDRVSQVVSCPFSGNYVEMAYYLYLHTTQLPGTGSDYLRTDIKDSGGDGPSHWTYIGSIAADTWVRMPGTLGVWPYACEPGETWQVTFEAVTDAANPTWFLVDDVSLVPCCADDAREPNDSFSSASAVSRALTTCGCAPAEMRTGSALMRRPVSSFTCACRSRRPGRPPSAWCHLRARR